MQKKRLQSLLFFILSFFYLIMANNLIIAQENLESIESSVVKVKRYSFSETDKDAQMWSALYIGSNGKIYVGLCTHADAANLYEFDPTTKIMRHLANLTILSNERGKGIWTTGKIHVQMQELDGYVYFGSLCEDSGPPAIDAASYNGPHWYRIKMETGEVDELGLINSFWGIIGQTMDTTRRIIYGLAENGHLYRYFIDQNYTEDMDRVDNWDICRTIFIDDIGNVYGSYPPGMLWKYDVEKDRIFDMDYLRLPLINQSRTMANPMLDRKEQWRIIQWDPIDNVAYGIVGGSNLLFKYDVHSGPEGTITPLVQMCAPQFRNGDPMNIPYATLAMAISQKERKIYYIPVTGGDFDYGIVTKDLPAVSYLIDYDLNSGQRTDHGILKTEDELLAFGMQSAKVDKDGKLWFVGAFQESNPQFAVGKLKGKYYYSMGLGCYNPFKN